MRLKYMIAVPFLIVFVLYTQGIKANAMDTGFSVENFAKENEEVFLSNVSFELIKEEPQKEGIQCFDVNEKGLVAIGQKDGREKKVCIYSRDGLFLYGYSFSCSQSFAVEWDDENINIYFARSDALVSLDSTGNILDIKEVENTIDNNIYCNHLRYSTSRMVEGVKYEVRKNVGIFNVIMPTYSQLLTVDTNGEEVVIYDVSSAQFNKMIVISVLAIMLLGIVIMVVWHTQKRQ